MTAVHRRHAGLRRHLAELRHAAGIVAGVQKELIRGLIVAAVKVQPGIAVHIHCGDARGPPPARRHAAARLFRDLRELKISRAEIDAIPLRCSAEDHIKPPVAVEVTHRHAADDKA